MIVEYIRYKIASEKKTAFVNAYQEAATIALDPSPNCLAYELSQGVEEPENFLLRIEWDSIEGHMEGFRKSSLFQPFVALVRPFYNDILEMKHYEVSGIVTKKSLK